MKIREAIESDARQIVRIFHETVHTINARDYTQEQVDAWSPAMPDPEVWVRRRFGTRTTFVADEEGAIAGFGELESDGHVDCLYCHRKRQRQGVGSAIMAEIEARARSLGVRRLFLEASITARPFFEARGFVVLRQQTVVRRGVELTNFVMEKVLTEGQE